MKQITVVLVGAGNRANVYASVSFKVPERLKVVGIVEPDPIRAKLMGDRYQVPKENMFSSVEEFVKRDKFADAVINGTMDHLHVRTSVPVLEKGYDLLLEKPFAVSEEEVNTLVQVARKYGSRVVIGHVLRYTDFYRAIKDHVLAGEIGDIISVEMNEHVNYHHMATSYVRGKWRSEKLCYAPMLLAKSCHDIDILIWMMKDAMPTAVASFGSDIQFGKSRKPADAGSRCMVDCKHADDCIFSAKNIYLPFRRWPQYVWKCVEGELAALENDEDAKAKIRALKEKSLMTDNEYGKCVWDFERDGNVDHQTVIVNFSNGATGTFSMIGGSAKSERNIHIVGTRGEIKGVFEDSKFVIRHMDLLQKEGYTEDLYDLNIVGDKTGERGGHGGGDGNLVMDFLDYLNGEAPSVSCATLEDSKISHITVFRAEEARKTGTVVPITWDEEK